MGSTLDTTCNGPRPDTVPAPETHGRPCLTIERPMLVLDHDQLIVRTFRSFGCVGMQTLTRTARVLRSQPHHHDSRLFDQSPSAKSSQRMRLLPANLEFLLGARTGVARNDQHPKASRIEAISSQHFLRC